MKKIYIYADWMETSPLLMGILNVIPSRNKEVFSYEYDSVWLTSKNKYFLDPDLQFFSGKQYPSEEKNNFGVFLDSSPDRWGRLLMRRREILLAKKEERKPKNLLESDYLLGVFDENRMGGLRFKENPDGEFLNNNKELSAPPWSSLRELENASLQLERKDLKNELDYLKWLNMLIAPGSSLGGSRPKASITDGKNNLWIAKFPSRYDDVDTGAWEMVVNQLAKLCGINIAEGMIQKFSSQHHTFLSKRFDRINNKRIHFASAMTLLGYTDCKSSDDGLSYLEIAEFIIKYGVNVEKDLEELWRRIVFNICVKNTDDHLRNHGFLLTKEGWILSPAYDINPIESGTALKLNISEDDNSLDLDLALEVSIYFRLNKSKAENIIKEIKKSIKKWKSIAGKLGIPKSERIIMEQAFEIGLS